MPPRLQHPPGPRDPDAVAGADRRARPAAEHVHHVGGADRLLEVVRHQQHGEPLALDPLQELLGDAGPDDRIERGERLVHEQQPGPQRQHLRDGHPLALPAGELARIAVAAAGQPQHLQPVLGPLVGRGRRDLPDPQSQRHVPARRAPRQQRVVLEQEADVARPDVQLDRAAQRLQQAGHHPQDAGLAGTGRADQGCELPRRHVEIDAFEDRLPAVADRQTAYPQHLSSAGGRYPAAASASSRVPRSTCPGCSRPATCWARRTRPAASTSTVTRSG